MNKEVGTTTGASKPTTVAGPRRVTAHIGLGLASGRDLIIWLSSVIKNPAVLSIQLKNEDGLKVQPQCPNIQKIEEKVCMK